MAKNKKPLEEKKAEEPLDIIPSVPIDSKEPEEVTVNSITQAEVLQKSGWQLLDCHHTPKGKEYKFRKVKK